VADAVDIHLADVDGEEARFKQAIDAKVASEVGGAERRAAAATSAITANTQQIEQLQARVAELATQIGTFQQDVAQATADAANKRAEIEQATAQFKMAAQVVKQELQGHKSTILSALG
jgi:chromosome segregation ATPase